MFTYTYTCDCTCFFFHTTLKTFTLLKFMTLKLKKFENLKLTTFCLFTTTNIIVGTVRFELKHINFCTKFYEIV